MFPVFVGLGSRIACRLDCGNLEPWTSQERLKYFSAYGGYDVLPIHSDADIDSFEGYEIAA